MKKLINTIADYIVNFKSIAWYELPVIKTAKKALSVLFKALDGSLWEVNAKVENGLIKPSSVVFQGCLF